MKTEHVLFIDSRKTDSSSNVNFSVKLQGTKTTYNSNGSIKGYENSLPGLVYNSVKSVELLSISFAPRYSSTRSLEEAGYVILSISELEGRLDSNHQHVHGQFAVIYLEKSDPHDSFISTNIKGADFDIKQQVFNPPLTSLNKLTIKLINPLTGECIDDNGYILLCFKVCN